MQEWHKEAIRLRQEGIKYEAIAAILGKSRNTVQWAVNPEIRKRKNLTRQKLRGSKKYLLFLFQQIKDNFDNIQKLNSEIERILNNEKN